MKNSNLKKALANFNAKMDQDIEVINPEMVVGGAATAEDGKGFCFGCCLWCCHQSEDFLWLSCLPHYGHY